MRKFALKKIAIYFKLVIFFSFFQVIMIAAQIPVCTSQNSAPVDYRGWARGSTVQIYIAPSITGERRDAVIQAFNNWEQSSTENGSNISYQFVSTPPPNGTGFTVLNQQPASNNRASTDVINNDTTGDTMSATTYLAPTMTNPAAVLEAMSHEIST